MPNKFLKCFGLIMIALTLCFALVYFLPPEFGAPKRRNYNSDYTQEEIKFGEEKLYPQAGTPENMIKIYAEGLKNKDKLTVKLLSLPMFLTISPEMWEAQFDEFWQKYQGVEITYSELKYDRESGCEKGFFITTKDKTVDNKFVCVNKSYYGWENHGQVFNEFKSYYGLILWR